MKINLVLFAILIVIIGYWLIKPNKDRYNGNTFDQPNNDFYFLFYEYEIPKQEHVFNVHANDLPLKNVYNDQMRKCLDQKWCENAKDTENCLNECAMSAVIATGFFENSPPKATFVNPITFEMAA